MGGMEVGLITPGSIFLQLAGRQRQWPEQVAGWGLLVWSGCTPPAESGNDLQSRDVLCAARGFPTPCTAKLL